MTKSDKKSNSLGFVLRTARDIKAATNLKEWSLRQVAKRADITPTYLKKLEDDEVKEPSPNILFRLSNVLGIPYADLMKLVGYVVPCDEAETPSHSDTLAVALRSADLTEKELKHMIDYLAFTKNKS